VAFVKIIEKDKQFMLNFILTVSGLFPRNNTKGQEVFVQN